MPITVYIYLYCFSVNLLHKLEGSDFWKFSSEHLKQFSLAEFISTPSFLSQVFHTTFSFKFA